MESQAAESPKHVTKISRRSWIMVIVAIFSVLLFINRFSVQLVSSANLFFNCFSVLPLSQTGGVSATIPGRSLLSSDAQCEVGTVPVVVDVRAEYSQFDGHVTTKEGNLRLSHPAVTLNAAQNSGDHKFSARLAVNHKHKNRFCLRTDSEYVFILGSAEKAASLSGVHFKLCGEQFSDLSKQLVVRATQDSCSVREAVIASSTITSAAVDCTDEPTSAPTSMPTRFGKKRTRSLCFVY